MFNTFKSNERKNIMDMNKEKEKIDDKRTLLDSQENKGT